MKDGLGRQRMGITAEFAEGTQRTRRSDRHPDVTWSCFFPSVFSAPLGDLRGCIAAVLPTISRYIILPFDVL